MREVVVGGAAGPSGYCSDRCVRSWERHLSLFRHYLLFLDG